MENVLSFVINRFEKKEDISTLLLDLSKGFDLVPHREVIDNLHYYGLVQNNARTLLSSYLSDNFQFIRLGPQNTDLQRVTSDVPQDSVLCADDMTHKENLVW